MSNKRKLKICLYIQNILTPQKGLSHKHGCKKHLTLDSSNGTSSASHDGVARLGASTSLGGALIIAFIPSLLSSQQTDHVPLPPSQTEHPHVYSCLRRGGKMGKALSASVLDGRPSSDSRTVRVDPLAGPSRPALSRPFVGSFHGERHALRLTGLLKFPGWKTPNREDS